MTGPPARIGHYSITGTLGQGGMGIVYSARDERLERIVALKTMSSTSFDEDARRRFWREARSAARVNHPNICQLYEVGEAEGRLFIAMELLQGEPLAERVRRGPLGVNEALPLAIGVLKALSALHAHGVIHRDLKPSNVFLTPHGVKLLDFGLARAANPAEDASAYGSVANLTRAGMLLGTPRYMAPEQISGETVDARSDLFAFGVILFEMLAGRPPFDGRNVVEILHATLHDQPPALSGSPAAAAVDRVIRRALAKRASERPASADAIAEELRQIADLPSPGSSLARPLTRLVVLPFRVLRSDPETDFLAFSLPDAIATSLSGIGSLIVRSTAATARFGEAPDLRALATEADVDRVVMGTLLRVGDRLRATAQLVDAPAGTLVTSHSIQASLGDLFHLQDDIARRVVEALSLPLGGGGPSSSPDTPHDAEAYGIYLRANQLALNYDQLPQARDLYESCLKLDPGFAPAWARLGRCLRVIGKYIDDSPDTGARGEHALRRALELNPRLSIAHKFYATLEADQGRVQQALLRLLGEAGRHGNDPELFAGLVQACRYGGLFEQSILAHDEARRLDPNVVTSVEQTLLMAGDVVGVLAADRPLAIGGGDDVIRIVGLGLTGRRDVARQRLAALRHTIRITAFQVWADFLGEWLDRRPDLMRVRRAALDRLHIMEDPEAVFQEGWLYCDAGDHAQGLELLRLAVTRGYYVAPTLSASAQFDPIREEPAFQDMLGEAEAGRARLLAAFRDAGGERLLGHRSP